MGKKKGGFKLIFALLLLAALLVGGALLFNRFYNKQLVDMTYRYDRAIIRLPDDTIITGRVESWNDYADGDQIQVRIEGKTYLVHSSMVALIND